MKVLYLHQYFKTPDEGGSLRSWHFASALARAGHHVTVITSHNFPGIIRKNFKGFEVIYLPVPYNQSYSTFKRLKTYYLFAEKAYKECLKIPADICFATSTPLTAGWAALKLNKRRCLPYIFEARDLWPEVPIQIGVFRDPFSKYFLRRIEKQIYGGAEKIIALSPGIREAIEKTAPEKEVKLIPNMADTNFFQGIKTEPIRSEAFTICYTGAIGKANRLEYLLHLAKQTKEKNLPVNYIICGTGSELEAIKTIAAEQDLSHVAFTGHVSKEQVKSVLLQSDASYISFDANEIYETCSPNKFFDALAAGRICITNTGGWIRKLIEDNQCGFYAGGDDPETAIRMLEKVIYNQDLKENWKKNAGKLAEQFSLENLTTEFLQLFDESNLYRDNPSS